MLPAFTSIEPYAGRRHGGHFAHRSGGDGAGMIKDQLQIAAGRSSPRRTWGRSVSARHTRLASSFVAGKDDFCTRDSVAGRPDGYLVPPVDILCIEVLKLPGVETFADQPEAADRQRVRGRFTGITRSVDAGGDDLFLACGPCGAIVRRQLR